MIGLCSPLFACPLQRLNGHEAQDPNPYEVGMQYADEASVPELLGPAGWHVMWGPPNLLPTTVRSH
jgi:hypothetical protein